MDQVLLLGDGFEHKTEPASARASKTHHAPRTGAQTTEVVFRFCWSASRGPRPILDRDFSHIPALQYITTAES